jgi:hypothetical protein
MSHLSSKAPIHLEIRFRESKAAELNTLWRPYSVLTYSSVELKRSTAHLRVSMSYEDHRYKKRCTYVLVSIL